MFGYWTSLLASAVLPVSVTGPVLWQSLSRSVFCLCGFFQVVGFGAVILLGLCLHRRVRQMGCVARCGTGAIVGGLAIPCGYATQFVAAILVRVLEAR